MEIKINQSYDKWKAIEYGVLGANLLLKTFSELKIRTAMSNTVFPKIIFNVVSRVYKIWRKWHE